MGLLDKR